MVSVEECMRRVKVISRIVHIIKLLNSAKLLLAVQTI
jgi:hypothetical protein